MYKLIHNACAHKYIYTYALTYIKSIYMHVI